MLLGFNEPKSFPWDFKKSALTGKTWSCFGVPEAGRTKCILMVWSSKVFDSNCFKVLSVSPFYRYQTLIEFLNQEETLILTQPRVWSCNKVLSCYSNSYFHPSLVYHLASLRSLYRLIHLQRQSNLLLDGTKFPYWSFSRTSTYKVISDIWSCCNELQSNPTYLDPLNIRMAGCFWLLLPPPHAAKRKAPATETPARANSFFAFIYLLC